MLVDVLYEVPVLVRVDTWTGKVERVVVLDEEIRGSDERPCEANEPGKIVPRGVGAAAIQIADDTEWPAWEHGL